MDITITPHKLSGSITPPPSKSQAHRAIIAAALAGGTSRIDNLADSQDIRATRRCMDALLAPPSPVPSHVIASQSADWRGNPLPSSPAPVGPGVPDGPSPFPPLLDCGESGSTLRFLIPVALALRGGADLTGSVRLLERPLAPYNSAFQNQGVLMGFRPEMPKTLRVSGVLKSGIFEFPGDVSSQFITGMLYALPLLAGDSTIMLTTDLESRGYVDMTLDVLDRFGIRVDCPDGRTFHVPGNQTYRPVDMTIESDYSQAAFYYAANGLGSDVDIRGLNPFSTQGDMCIVPYYLKLCQSGEVELDVSQCPDLVPALAAHAALRDGQLTRITNAARLRIKESDRLDTVTTQLCQLGAQIEQSPDALTIRGVDRLTGGVVDGCNDHRIAMMLAVAATRTVGPVTIRGAECVAKSYPNFWEDYQSLGGIVK